MTDSTIPLAPVGWARTHSVPGSADDSLEAAIRRCESEPIQFVGAIQPHGYMLAFDPWWQVSFASANAAALFGQAPERLIGQSARAVLGEAAARTLNETLSGSPLSLPRNLRLTLETVAGRTAVSAWFHALGQTAVVEFEPDAETQESLACSQEGLTELLRQFQFGSYTIECCNFLAEQFRLISGFDRVLIYRFDEQWDGEVIAESRNDILPSLLGNRFPAGDIPPQARALYARSPVRALADIDAVPVPLVGGQGVAGGHALDMSQCVLRAMSPVHIEYMRNMGVRASLSVSLLLHGRLWGLIACHHATPHPVSFQRLGAAEIAGRLASLKIASLEDARQVSYLQRIRHILGRLTEQFSATQDTEAISRLLETDILRLVGASGCLLVTPDRQFEAGQVPAPSDMPLLVEWLQGRLARERLFCTEQLSRHYPAGEELTGVAAGLLAINLLPERGIFIIWFRREQIHDIAWAGKPDKVLVGDGAGARIEPRRSFAQWVETVRGKSQTWEPIQIDAARTISHALQALFTERSLWTTEHALRITAESASRLKSQFLRNISHEIRTPLHAVLAFSRMSLGRLDELPRDKLETYLQNISTSAGRLNTLIDELLHLAHLQARQVTLHPQTIDMRQLINSKASELAPLFAGRSLRFQLLIETDDSTLRGDDVLLGRVLFHLLANAQKFSPVAGLVETVLRNAELPGLQGPVPALEIIVRDEGVGIPEEELENIFEGFSQSTRTYRGDGGTGLGLAVCREIARLHMGDIRAGNRPEGGAFIACRLPRGF